MIKLQLLFICTCFFSISLATASQGASVYEIDVAGFESYGTFDATENSRILIDVFPNARIISVEWINLEFTTENGSWMNELVLSVNHSANSSAPGTYWDYRPSNDGFPGTYSGSGIFDNVNSEFSSGPFNLDADGKLLFFVYDTFDDDGFSARDALITSGIVRITAVPEPTALALLAGISILVGARKVPRRHFRRCRNFASSLVRI